MEDDTAELWMNHKWVDSWRHPTKLSYRFPISADDDDLTVLLNLYQQLGEVCLGLMCVHRDHDISLAKLSLMSRAPIGALAHSPDSFCVQLEKAVNHTVSETHLTPLRRTTGRDVSWNLKVEPVVGGGDCTVHFTMKRAQLFNIIIRAARVAHQVVGFCEANTLFRHEARSGFVKPPTCPLQIRLTAQFARRREWEGEETIGWDVSKSFTQS